MEKPNKLTTKKLIIIIAAIFLACLAALGIAAYIRGNVKQVASQEDYGYVNPDETKADPDEGITIDGVLDEAVYQNNNWLYLHNDNGNSKVDIASTSYYGEKGMYFVYDVTENTPIYVNLDRTSALNSCVEMYLATSDVETMDSSNIFEIDLLPTGDLVFKQRNGKGAFMDVATTSDIMPYLGVTTKGGEVNSEDCYGYNLEFFIPWDYMEWLGMPVEEMKSDYVNVNIAHITSFNYAGEDANIDRFWYSFAKQRGGNGWGNVPLYYHFNEDGALQTVPVELVAGEHYTIEGAKTVIPGMKAHVTITPEEGYALNSILVNEEEYIQKVSYNEDGSVELLVKGVKDGLKISASAEMVAEGNKTLSGAVKVHKLGGDNLKGVVISYNGPNGEKPITLDAQGNFTLTDLKQGYYTITVEKSGYEKIVRSICLNRDIHTELTLEYQKFTVESGNCWNLDDQNDSILNKLGGSGSVITTDSYNKFTAEANFRYDTQLAKDYDFTDCSEQRQGFRIKFSNGKYWHLHLLYQNEKYIVQYAKVTGENSIFNFRNIYTLSEDEIAKYQSADGIQFKLVRDGKYANIYLGGTLIAVELLDDEYNKLTAQVGFESWVMNFDYMSMNYKITGNNEYNIKNFYFGYHKGWDVTKQYEGIVSQPNGGNTVWLRFYDKLENMDLTIKVKDDPRVDGENPRTSIRFEFDNKETFIVSVCESAKGVVQIQKYPCTVTNNKWAGSYYNFTAEEKAQYKTEEGIDLRVVRSGTDFLLFVGGEYKTTIDLSDFIKGDTKAIVSIQHLDDKGVPYVMPFTMSDKVEEVTITKADQGGKEFVTEKGTFVVVSAEEGYYISKIKVNGKDVSTDLYLDGTYTFTAEESKNTIQATIAKRVFKTTNGWDLLEQNQGTNDKGATIGTVALPEGGSADGRLYFLNQYTDVDLTLTVKDDQSVGGINPRTTIRFNFDNGEDVDFSISSVYVNKETGNQVVLQNTDSTIYGKNKRITLYPIEITEEDKVQTAKYESADGLDVRVVRNGTEFTLYFENGYDESLMNRVWYVDLAEYIKADTKATISIEHFDDKGAEIEMPFSITDKLEKVAVKVEGSNGKKVLTDKNQYVLGDTVLLTAEEGYYISKVSVNGKDASADLNLDGTYSFTATETKYDIKATVKESVVKAADSWDVREQNQETKDGVTKGKIVLTNGGSGKIDFCDEYANVDLTVKVKDDPSVSGQAARTTVHFAFENGQTVNFSTSAISSPNLAVIQTTPCTIYGQKWINRYALTQTERKQYETAEGIDFRVVRDGTEFFLYFEDPANEGQMSRVWYVDLKDYIKEDTKAAISIEHGDDKGVDIAIPYKITNKVEKSMIDVQTGEYGTISATLKHSDDNNVKDNVIYVGDTVVVKQTALSNAVYYLSGVKLDNKEYNLELDGTYSFIAGKAEHTIKGVYKKAIFNTSSQWCLVRQNEGTDANGAITGTVSIMNVGPTALTLREQYQDIDLTIRVKDHPGVSGTNPRTNIRFDFTNGKSFVFGVNEDSNGVVQVENDANKNIVYYEFTSAEREQYKTENGIDLRVVREGYKLSVYVGGDFKKSIYLDDLGVDNSMKTTVKIEHFDDKASGVRIEMPFKLSVPSKEYMAGKYFSILGDEISMCKNMPRTESNNDTTDKNSTMDMYGQNGGLGIASDYTLMYWGQAQKTNQLQLLVNNTVSVGELAVTANKTSHVAGYVRAEQLADNTDDGIAKGTKPDIIYLYMGTQDYKQQKLPLGEYTEAVVSGVKTQDGYKTPETFTEAYIITLEKMQELYPDAEVFCFTLLPFKNTDYDKTVQANYNARIREIAGDYENVTLVDVTDIITPDNYTTDSYYFDASFTTIKPKKASHDVIASELQKALESQFKPIAHVTIKSSNYGTISSDKTTYDYGETVVITGSATNPSEHFLAGLEINGERYTFDSNGQYRFVANEVSYVIEGIYEDAVFTENTSWDLTEQVQNSAGGVTSGIVTLLSEGNGAKLALKNTYTDISLALTVKNVPNSSATAKNTIQFAFANNKIFSLSVVENDSDIKIVDESGKVYYTFGTDEVTKYETTEGIAFKVVREGYKLSIHVGNEFKKSIYLDGTDYGVENATMATVSVQHTGDNGVQVSIPYELSVPSRLTLSGKYFSILGDEIGMCKNMPRTESNNDTTGKNSTMDMYGQNGGLGIASDYTLMYWGQAQKTNQLQLLVNNSVSVGELAVTANATSHIAGYIRAEQLADNTDDGIAKGTKPDIIYLYMGTQDYKQQKLPLGEYTEAVVAGVKTEDGYKTPETFTEAYIITLEKMQELYPDAEVFCFTLLPYKDTSYDKTVQANYNARIREIACDYENVTLVDVTDIVTPDNYRTDSYYFDANLTTIKPKKASHDVIASELQKALESQFTRPYLTSSN